MNYEFSNKYFYTIMMMIIEFKNIQFIYYYKLLNLIMIIIIVAVELLMSKWTFVTHATQKLWIDNSACRVQFTSIHRLISEMNF